MPSLSRCDNKMRQYINVSIKSKSEVSITIVQKEFT